MNHNELRESLAEVLKQSLPYWETDDKDEYMYVVRPNQLGIVVDALVKFISSQDTSKSDTLDSIEEEVRGKIKYHKEFECNGANNGKGCYEDWCEDQNCRNAPKEWNEALDKVLQIISSYKK
jgi:hypothetical protein